MESWKMPREGGGGEGHGLISLVACPPLNPCVCRHELSRT